MSTKSHWEKIYSEKSPQEVSWTQEIPVTSIEFFEDFKLSKTSPIIDIGGGESKFVDYLLDNEYQNISVLDISESAIKRAKDRLGEKSKKVDWIVCDINNFAPKKKYALWHDRAVFHFLTSDIEINKEINCGEVKYFEVLNPQSLSSLLIKSDQEIKKKKNIMMTLWTHINLLLTL